MTVEQDNIEARKRRAIYRSNYRGTKEMDIMVGRYAKATIPDMSEETLTLFEEFLAVPDRDIEGWVMRNEYPEDGEYIEFVKAIREFHGL